MSASPEKKPEGKLGYREALGMFRQAIKEITPEDVADVIHESYEPLKVMEIQETLFLLRQNRLETELKEAEEREKIEKSPAPPPQKKGGRR